MANLSLQQIFGANAIQDIDTVTISKADLNQGSGLTPADENDGESLLVGVLLQAQSLGLTIDARDGFSDESNSYQQVAISPPSITLIPRQDTTGNISFFKRDSYIIDLDVPLPDVDPNLY